MNHSEFIVSNTFRVIKSSAISTETTAFGGHIVARTGIFSTMLGDSRKKFFGGFSCKPRAEEAIHVAPYEVAERILATYKFSNPIYRDSKYEIFSLIGDKPMGYVRPDEVILGPVPYNLKNNLDAVGLSFHLEKDMAVKHAIYELIERNILCKIWYEDHPLIKISEHKIQDTCYILSNYTISHNPIVPFVMSVIYEKNYEFLCVGAAVSDSISNATLKSSAEAIMLSHDVILEKSLNNISNMATKERMLSQANPVLSRDRNNYLSKSLKLGDYSYDPNRFFSVSDILRLLDISEDDICYCILHSSLSGVLIRAISKKLKTLRFYRNHYLNTDKFFLDPIC